MTLGRAAKVKHDIPSLLLLFETHLEGEWATHSLLSVIEDYADVVRPDKSDSDSLHGPLCVQGTEEVNAYIHTI